MDKIMNWDNVQAVSPEHDRLPAGGYVGKIIKAVDMKSKSGKKMLALAVDIAEGKYTDFYAKQWNLARAYDPDAKWRCWYYQLYEGESVGRFKGLIELIAKCNPGFVWNWNELDLQQKKIGCIFREEEYINRNNQVGNVTRLWQMRPLEGIENVPVPAPKKLSQNQYSQWGSVPGSSEGTEEIPF